jgi:CII-binding regulator of phage lambda lysogenization HflD
MSDIANIAYLVDQLATQLDCDAAELMDCIVGILISDEERGKVLALLDDLKPLEP